MVISKEVLQVSHRSFFTSLSLRTLSTQPSVTCLTLPSSLPLTLKCCGSRARGSPILVPEETRYFSGAPAFVSEVLLQNSPSNLPRARNTTSLRNIGDQKHKALDQGD